MRLWIPEETFVDNEQQFMNMLVGKIEAILSQEPVDICESHLPSCQYIGIPTQGSDPTHGSVIKVMKDNDVALRQCPF
jgi:hypothetical protein